MSGALRSTPLEHDVLLPRDAKDAGVPHTPSWDGESVLPRTTSIRLRAGECFIRSGITIHRGHAQRGERLTLAGAGCSAPLRSVLVASRRPTAHLRRERAAVLPDGQRLAHYRV
jgi:hypothetical protein